MSRSHIIQCDLLSVTHLTICNVREKSKKRTNKDSQKEIKDDPTNALNLLSIVMQCKA